MKEYTFVAYCTFGKGDSGESWVDVELTDEESDMLIKYGTQTDIYYNGFFHCTELKELYDKIYDISIHQMTEEMKTELVVLGQSTVTKTSLEQIMKIEESELVKGIH